ncbi:MAG: hypothetical protein AAB375_02955 [Patescibacteria group bacterium]
MSKRSERNLFFGIGGISYILVGAVASVGRYLSVALIAIGTMFVVAVAVNLLTPQDAEDLHIKP